MSGRFLTQKDMAAAKHVQEVWNSRVNRGQIDESNLARLHMIVCGCGEEGCLFLAQRKHDGTASSE